MTDAWTVKDPTLCPECGRDACEEHLPGAPVPTPAVTSDLLACASSDLGNAEYFAHRHGSAVRYDHRRRQWMVWAAPAWRRDTDGEVQRLAHLTVRQRQADALLIENQGARDAAMKWAMKSENRDRLGALLAIAQTLPPIATAGDAWDADPWLFTCANGVIDLRTGILRPGRPEDALLMRTSVAYDPEAACPRFEQFLDEVFDGDRDRVEWLQRAIGYSLTGNTSEQVWFLLHGTGANGKGTFTRVIGRIVGDYGWNLPFSSFAGHASSIPNDLAALAGRRFVTASEANDGTRLNEARIKSLTGEDDITARYLHAEFFTFRPAAKLWLSVNHRPEVKDQTHGFWRRLREIPFTRTFTIDRTLEPALMAETPGILAWAVRGAVRWQQEGLENLPAAVADAIADYKAESDTLADFLAARCVCLPGVSAKAGALFHEYVTWAERTHVAREDRLTQTGFGRALTARGFAKAKDRTGSSYHGIAITASEVAA